MLKEYFDRCDQTSVKSVSTLANVETPENCTENDISVDSSEKDFNQSVRLKNSEILANLDTKQGHLDSHKRKKFNNSWLVIRPSSWIFPRRPPLPVMMSL
jgi:hypothetical protein